MMNRHVRTSAGILFMLLGAVAVLGSRWIEPAHVGCAATWVEVVHKFGFPTLLFLGGMALFHKASFDDLVAGSKALVGKVIRRKP